eukprot:CAMPEP_0194764848 /NCGR_PEP_ID=MMETSP0323_2-20130528/23869_1 /TAXON_ID=2866 ORGANISM="Crypthecodinium cohnii, Strain Seligo" /NCGR_SAMPLE_ID=MMETSP0323_2 /ASSEMBLY_ACC=CAM_ASM_000346 /LENGTH=52 /DNA_ID=CAMNT_0039692925 /DNA_START=50 /DNA_END=205 /DNA_ORIENTATION=-
MFVVVGSTTGKVLKLHGARNKMKGPFVFNRRLDEMQSAPATASLGGSEFRMS